MNDPKTIFARFKRQGMMKQEEDLYLKRYSAAVILNEDFNITMVKDSKKFTSNKKLQKHMIILFITQAYSINL